MLTLYGNRCLLSSLTLCALAFSLERIDSAAVSSDATYPPHNRASIDDGWRRTAGGWEKIAVMETSHGMHSVIRAVSPNHLTGRFHHPTRRMSAGWPIAFAAAELFFLLWCLEQQTDPE